MTLSKTQQRSWGVSFALSSGQTGLHTCNLKKRLSEEKDFVQDLDQMMKQDMVELVDMVGTPGGIGGIRQRGGADYNHWAYFLVCQLADTFLENQHA